MKHELYSSQGYVGPMAKTKPLPIHPFESYYDYILAYENYRRVYNDGRGQDTGQGSCLHTSPHSVEFYPTVNFSNVYARALDKLTEQVRGSLDLSVDLLQSGQILKMFNARKRILDYTKTFMARKLPSRKGKGGYALTEDWSKSKYLASLHLEYIYGVKPLMGTLFGAADEMLNHVINETARFRVRVTDMGYKPNEFGVSMYWGIQRFRPTELRMKVSTTLGVDVRTDQHDLARWTSLNPLSIAWELMPWSFVADWFLDIGGYLRNMETALLYANKFRSGYRTNFVAFEGKGTVELGVPAGSSGGDSITTTVKGFRISRTLMTSYPIPQLPSFQADLGSSRLLAGAALLAQLLPGGRKTIHSY